MRAEELLLTLAHSSISVRDNKKTPMGSTPKKTSVSFKLSMEGPPSRHIMQWAEGTSS